MAKSISYIQCGNWLEDDEGYWTCKKCDEKDIAVWERWNRRERAGINKNMVSGLMIIKNRTIT